jgi:serine/threonine-protein kinase PpkA
VTDQVIDATVLFSDIRNFTSLAERLNSQEVAELLTVYFERTCDPVLKNGGRNLKFIGDGLMAVFSDTHSGSPLPAARRAVSAALAMALATHEFRSWLQHRFADRGLPPFAIGVGLHAGEVTLCRLGTIQNKETTPIGDTVNVAARLEASSKELGWTVVASNHVLERAGDGVQTGGMTSLAVRGKNLYVDVAEITGLVTNMDDKVHGMATLTERGGRSARGGADQFRDHGAGRQGRAQVQAVGHEGPVVRPRRGAAAPEGLPHHAQDRRGRHDPGVPGRARRATACPWC